MPLPTQFTIPPLPVIVILPGKRYGANADTPFQYGVGQPLPVVFTIPRDWLASVPASPQFVKARHGVTADTPFQYGVGQPLPIVAVFPRDWSASVPASPLQPARFGTWDLSPTLSTYGQPIAPLVTVPPAPAFTVALLSAVRYGATIDVGPPPGYGQPLPTYVTVPRDWSTAVPLLPSRFGTWGLADTLPTYGQPLRTYVTLPHDWSSAVPAAPLRFARFGTWGLSPTLPAYGQPITPLVVIPTPLVSTPTSRYVTVAVYPLYTAQASVLETLGFVVVSAGELHNVQSFITDLGGAASVFIQRSDGTVFLGEP